MYLRDQDVRDALCTGVLAEHADDDDTLVLHEFGLWHGSARVDIVVINATIHGFEIKSDLDTLERLPSQAEIYNAVLDYVTIVTGIRHLDRVASIVPGWWGLAAAISDSQDTVFIESHREASANPQINPLAVAALLWRDEALSILEANGVAQGVRGKNRNAIYQRLIETVSLDCLRALIRCQLKARTGWRSA